MPIDLGERDAGFVYPLDCRKGDKAIGAGDDDVLDRASGARQAQRFHARLDRRRRAAEIGRHGARTVSHNKHAVLDLYARVAAGDRQNAVADAPVKIVAAKHLMPALCAGTARAPNRPARSTR